MAGTHTEKIDTHQNPLVLYDGLCGLCHKAVQWILERDKKEKFRFATLQGDLARQYLQPDQRQKLESVVVLSRGAVFEESAAFFEIASRIGGWPAVLSVFRFLPSFISDGVYRFIAKRRYGWFGKYDSCPIPDPKVRARFLD